MRAKRFVSWLAAATLVTGLLVAAGPTAPADPTGADLARGKPVTTSTAARTAATITDGDQETYWESAGSGEQWVRVDLGRTARLDHVTLRLPAGRSTRTQQFGVQASTDGATFTTAAGTVAHTFRPAAGNAVTIPLGAIPARFVRVGFGAGARPQLSTVEVYAAAAPVRLQVQAQSSSALTTFGTGNAVDGNPATYWESANNAFPQWIQVDLGASLAANQIVVKLPASWDARTQTLTVRQSTNGTTFTDLIAATGYRFDPATGNTVTIDFAATTTRYLRLHVTANTGWPAAQVAELEVYGPATGDTEAPTAPANLTLTQLAAGQLQLSW